MINCLPVNKDGQINLAGISLYNPTESLEWARESVIDSFQFPYNLIDRRLEDVLDELTKHGKALIIRSVFASGFWSGKYQADSTFSKNDHRRRFPSEDKEKMLGRIQDIQKEKGWKKEDMMKEALRFALKSDETSTVLLGVKNEEQLREHIDNYREIE